MYVTMYVICTLHLTFLPGLGFEITQPETVLNQPTQGRKALTHSNAKLNGAGFFEHLVPK